MNSLIAAPKYTALLDTSIRIVIFAKAPLPGFAKTRLIPSLGSDGAANLAKTLLKHTVDQALGSNVGTVELCVTPSYDCAIWKSMGLPGNIQWSNQEDGDLGDRLMRAARRVTANHEAILLIGTDCPDLSAERIRDAALALRENDTCLVPVVDGGYALLGLNHFLPNIFTGIPWSTARVANLTQKEILDSGHTMMMLPKLHDIDEPGDLQYLPDKFRC
ncbi:TIGR04282 family arsenosugar biosynthesis glycosyltransferase [Zhongshania borealis]|uniref:TIGR04282 family arsenosugar biosynthesis glycosyltransferase n=1 Tax=Zhongshania borealis TaxID=889488 RepID=A0ABP7WWZ0_9GAMM